MISSVIHHAKISPVMNLVRDAEMIRTTVQNRFPESLSILGIDGSLCQSAFRNERIPSNSIPKQIQLRIFLVMWSRELKSLTQDWWHQNKINMVV
jgi:hypothetical protein